MSDKGLDFGLRWVKAKFANQIEFLKEIRTRISADITTALENLQKSSEKLNELTGNF